jgi:hypothetical protein
MTINKNNYKNQTNNKINDGFQLYHYLSGNKSGNKIMLSSHNN